MWGERAPTLQHTQHVHTAHFSLRRELRVRPESQQRL